jgi:hypothetical protein
LLATPPNVSLLPLNVLCLIVSGPPSLKYAPPPLQHGVSPPTKLAVLSEKVSFVSVWGVAEPSS